MLVIYIPPLNCKYLYRPPHTPFLYAASKLENHLGNRISRIKALNSLTLLTK